MAAPKIYVLVTGELFQKIKNKKTIILSKAIETTDTWLIGGPLDTCAINRFENIDEWKCFYTLEEAREAASNL